MYSCRATPIWRTDAQRLGPQEQIEILKHLAAAEKIIALAAADRNITTERAANALTSTLRTASNPDNNIMRGCRRVWRTKRLRISSLRFLRMNRVMNEP
jgi:hypothetical protein